MKINVVLALRLYSSLPRECISCQTVEYINWNCSAHYLLRRVAISLESLLPEFLDRSSTRPYSSSISPMDGVQVPSCCPSESTPSVPDPWLLAVLPLLESLVGGGLGWVLGGSPRSVERWVCSQKNLVLALSL